MPMSVTDSAARQFSVLSQSQPGYPRIEIRAGGCNGFEKIFGWTTQPDGDDMIIPAGDSSIVIDKISYELLENAVVDYKRGIAGSFFSIEIPDASSTCGCGSSFSL